MGIRGPLKPNNQIKIGDKCNKILIELFVAVTEGSALWLIQPESICWCRCTSAIGNDTPRQCIPKILHHIGQSVIWFLFVSSRTFWPAKQLYVDNFSPEKCRKRAFNIEHQSKCSIHSFLVHGTQSAKTYTTIPDIYEHIMNTHDKEYTNSNNGSQQQPAIVHRGIYCFLVCLQFGIFS